MGSPGQTPPAHCAVRLFDQQYPVNLTTLPASSSSNDAGSNNAGSSGGGADKVSFTDMIAGSSVRMRLFLSALSLCLSRACLGKTIVLINKWLKKDRFLALLTTSFSPVRSSDVPSSCRRKRHNLVSTTLPLCVCPEPVLAKTALLLVATN